MRPFHPWSCAVLLVAGIVAQADGGDCLSASLVGGNFDVSDGATTQRLSPSVAFNTMDKQFLIVWFDTRNPGNNDVFGQRIAPDGSRLGANIPIMEFADAQIDPFVAYNGTNNEYLVTWRTQQAGDFNRGRGRRVAADGTLPGTDFLVTNAGFESSIAYNPMSNEFLYVARNFAGGGTAGIVGRRVAGGGGPVAGDIPISNVGAPAPCGQVAYDRVNDRFLATWRNQSSSNLQGQLISSAGTLIGGPILISSIFPASARAASVAFDPIQQRYLVVFGEFQNTNIWAQFVAADGSLIGANFLVASGLSGQVAPFLGYSSAAGAYLVVWSDSGNIVAQLLDTDGATVGAQLPLAAGTANFSVPQLAENPQTGELLVAWSDNRNAPAGQQDIFAQFVLVESGLPGDLDGDGDVDLADVGILLSDFGCTAGPGNCPGDADGDGDTDLADLGIVLSNFGNVCA